MELNHLKYFYEVARHGSFTKASRALKISQPSISKIIRQIEDAQNVRLFDRGKKGVTLTQAGRVFFESCSTIFREVESLRNSIEQQRDEVSGDLRIGASDNICNYVLPDLVHSFWLKYPKVRVKLHNATSSAIKLDLLEGRSELGVFYTPAREKELETRTLACVMFTIVCSRNNEFLAGKKFDPTKLEKAFYIGSRVEDYSTPYPTLRMLGELGVKPRLFFETNSQETQKRMAIREYGYTVVPRHMVREELKSGVLLEIKPPRAIGADISLVKRKGKALSKPAALFEEHLARHIAKFMS